MRPFARRSVSVTVTLLSGVAAAVLSACRDGDRGRTCVDAQDRVVPDSLCASTRSRRSGVGGAVWYPYHYRVGRPSFGRSGGGAHVGGGTVRGGFGGIGSGHVGAHA